MEIDSSALVAILFNEPERSGLEDRIRLSATRLIGAPTLVGTSMVVLSRRGPESLPILRDLLAGMRVETVPLMPSHVDVAVEAFRRFGKGRHEAGLNFGDCLSYALAKAAGEPLLFKGEDFARTDITSASV